MLRFVQISGYYSRECTGSHLDNHLRFGLLGSVADPGREDWGRSRERPGSHLDTIT